jgi:hypothetical protein
VTQALEIKAKAVYRRIFENPCVGGSIPPRATKKHQNHLRVVFSFRRLDNLPNLFEVTNESQHKRSN